MRQIRLLCADTGAATGVEIVALPGRERRARTCRKPDEFL